MHQVYRVYDRLSNKWLSPFEVCELPNGDLCSLKKTLFGNYKMKLLADSQYIRHRCTGNVDRNRKLVYEGDICCHVSNVTGIITYLTELSSFVLLDHKTTQYFHLPEQVYKDITVIANVCDNPEIAERELTTSENNNEDNDD